jgi:hypothetical protein
LVQLRKFEEDRDFDWNDLARLVRRTIVIDRDRINADCVVDSQMDLSDEERKLAA